MPNHSCYTLLSFSDPNIDNNITIITQCERDDYQSYFDSCFRVESNPATFADAVATCQSENAELASFSDRYQEALAQTVLYSNVLDSMWIGLAKNEVSRCSRSGQSSFLNQQ